MTSEERLKDLELLSVDERRQTGDVKTGFKYLKGGYTEHGERLYSSAAGDRTRSNGPKLQQEKRRLEMRKSLLSVRMVKQWNGLQFPLKSLDICKSRVDGLTWGGLIRADPALSCGLA